MKKMIRLFPLVLLAGLLVLATGSCSDSEEILGSGQASMTVAIHDQTGPLSEVWVTFSSVEVHQVDGGWIDLGIDYGTEFDIMTLVGPDNAINLTSSTVVPGEYDYIRLTISSLRVVLTDGTEVQVPIPPGGWQVAVNMTVTVEGTDNVTITMHFDVGNSFQVEGTSVIFDPSFSISGLR